MESSYCRGSGSQTLGGSVFHINKNNKFPLEEGKRKLQNTANGNQKQEDLGFLLVRVL